MTFKPIEEVKLAVFLLKQPDADEDMKTKAQNYYQYLKIMKKELNTQLRLLKEVCE